MILVIFSSLGFTTVVNIWTMFMRLFRSVNVEDNVISVVYNLMKIYKIKVTLSSIIEYLKTHRDYPSLKSVCSFLNEMNIVNYAIRIEEQELYDLNRPVLAHVNVSGGRIILIYSANPSEIVYTDSLYEKKKIKTQTFLDRWDGVIIIIEPSASSGDIEFNKRKIEGIISNMIIPTGALLFGLILYYGINNRIFEKAQNNIIFIIVLLTHSIGLLFSWLILKNELNLRSRFSEMLCHISNSMNCDAVSTNSISRIFGNITWADIGITWFASGFILLFTGQLKDGLNILSLLAYASLPYPLFSILYQKLIIKKWCLFCLLIQIVLLVEFLLLFKIADPDSLVFNNIIKVLIIYISFFLFEFLVKQDYIRRKENKSLSLDLLKIKRDPKTFIALLRSGEMINIPDLKPTVLLGRLTSKTTITIFLSFKCESCASMFSDILKLIEFSENVKVQLIFFPSRDENIQKFFNQLGYLMDVGDVRVAIDKIRTWYLSDNESRNELINSFKQDYEQMKSIELIKRSSECFKTGNILKVPAIFINGYPLPKMFEVEDIKYIIEDI